MKIRTTTMAIVACFIVSVHGQGFLNLNFESAYDLPGNPPEPLGDEVPIANALPDWTFGEVTGIYYVSNNFSAYASLVELEGGSLALSGGFSVALFDGGFISQTGQVPDDAESLQFEAEGPGAGGSLGASDLAVTLGGQTLSFSALSESPGYTVYGANVPAGMDGETEALSFSCFGVGSGGVVLDNIEFSTTGVPEPAEWAMIGLGTFLFWVRRPASAMLRRASFRR